MTPRKRLDIDFSDLLFALRHTMWSGDRAGAQRRAESCCSRSTLACLSVRSGFDALLSALRWERGSEIALSAMTIGDMPRIIEKHGLVPIPVDIDIETLAVNQRALRDAITPRTKAILVAHLFGSRMRMDPILAVAREHGLVVFEDCAQAYGADGYWGHQDSDVAMFSFGLIKTATALGGALLCFRDRRLRERVAKVQASWRVQSRTAFFHRIAKAGALVALGNRFIFTLFVALCAACGIDYDRVITRSGRGFMGGDLFDKIRRQPSVALLALLGRRLSRYSRARIERRITAAKRVIPLFPISRLGTTAYHHTYWVFPILHHDPQALMLFLHRRGFDATRGSSAMRAVEPPVQQASPVTVKQILRDVLYLPVDSAFSCRDAVRLAKALKDYTAYKSACSVETLPEHT